MQGKPWYTSKLIWLGVVTTLVGSLDLVARLLQQVQVTPSDIVLLASGILTVVLRVWFTEQPIA